jgi:hypothetical protein
MQEKMITDFGCSICNTPVFRIQGQNIELHTPTVKPEYVILCKECSRTKNIDELTKIAGISSELVIKELAKINKQKIPS